MISTAIRTVTLTKIYKSNNLKAVDNLDLEIKSGEIFGLLGPNGAGKTTLIRMLVGLLKSTSGEIFYDGDKLSSTSSQLHRIIGYVPQESSFWNHLTVYENLFLIGSAHKIPSSILKERIDFILKGLFLTDKKKERTNKLSGGMKRRLNIALGLIHDPEILFLDEVFVGLDPQSRVFLYDFLKQLAIEGNKTVIITSHLMEVVDIMSDRVGIMDDGKMLAIDSPENLKNTFGKGDVIELTIDKKFNDKLLAVIKTTYKNLDLKQVDNQIFIGALNAIKKLPTILNTIENEGFEVVDTRLRKQSLEDVFISLTGKQLRDN